MKLDRSVEGGPGLRGVARLVIAHGQEVEDHGSLDSILQFEALLEAVDGVAMAAEPVVDDANGLPQGRDGLIEPPERGAGSSR